MRPPLAALVRPAGLLLCAAVAVPAAAADRSGDRVGMPSARHAAEAVDRAVDERLAGDGVTAAPRADDVDFLRRVTLDVAGRLPQPDEIDAFLSGGSSGNGAAGDREEVINRLLGDAGYAENWAAYWRDVIYTHATDVRSQRFREPFVAWMTEQLAAGRGWDDIATDVITADGRVDENGATGLIFAQGGSGGEVAAEVSRIFLGIQIQCAECHDHPYDSWSREDFHHLAAYFPRVQVKRLDVDGDKKKRTWEVVARDGAGVDADAAEKRVARLKQALTARFRFFDKNSDGRLTEAELKKTPLGRAAPRVLKLGDTDGDGSLSRREAASLSIPAAALSNNRTTEHYMPDLANPESPGTAMDPRFFLTGATLRPGLTDERRRATAARLVTNDGWFARAAVNRVWTELIGRGFYEPVDDIGPERTAMLPGALDVLADGFARSGYDLRWLIRTIALTETYQRAVDDDAPAFAAAKATRLRSDQVLNSVLQVVGTGDLRTGRDFAERAPRGKGRRGKGKPQYGGRNGLQTVFEQTFGYDPSTPQGDLTGDVPQALFLMNGPFTQRLSTAAGFSPLARILRRHPATPAGNADAVAELYNVVLTREPTDAELKIAAEYLKEVPDRALAFEDLMWALLNGSEFLTRR